MSLPYASFIMFIKGVFETNLPDESSSRVFHTSVPYALFIMFIKGVFERSLPDQSSTQVFHTSVPYASFIIRVYETSLPHECSISVLYTLHALYFNICNIDIFHINIQEEYSITVMPITFICINRHSI